VSQLYEVNDLSGLKKEVTEKTATIDTTAAGGNVSLMTMKSSDD
jgi:delta 1-pyrroline-5-carboxylate dehydrogenase